MSVIVLILVMCWSLGELWRESVKTRKELEHMHEILERIDANS